MIYIYTLLLAVIANIDSFFSGLSFGTKRIHIPVKTKVFITLFTFLTSFTGYIVSKQINILIFDSIANILGSVILIIMGIIMLKKIVFKKSSENVLSKEIEFFSAIDKDKSQSISIFEGMFLMFALSIDSLALNFAYGMGDNTNILLPIFTGVFQYVFIELGIRFGKLVRRVLNKKFAGILINYIPGAILIVLGILKLI